MEFYVSGDLSRCDTNFKDCFALRPSRRMKHITRGMITFTPFEWRVLDKVQVIEHNHVFNYVSFDVSVKFLA
jgi:hypothetical protein